MEMPVQKAVKEFNALNGKSEAILLLTVKLYAYPKPNPQPRDVTQVLMAAQRQRKEVERRPKVKHEDGGRRGKTALHNIRHLCPPFSIVCINFYRAKISLFLGNGHYLWSSEGTTQGCNLAMTMFGLGITPMICGLDIS